MNRSSLLSRAGVAGVALCLAATFAGAQATGSISFDALPRRTRTDSNSTRRRDPVVQLRQQNAAQRDSIVRLVRALDSARAHVDTVLVPVAPRVDTVRIAQAELEVSGPSVAPAPAMEPAPTAAPTPAATPAPVTAPAPVAVALPSTTVSGMMQMLASGGDAGSMRSTFRIRRAELKLVSDLGGRATSTVMIDVSKALSIQTSGTTPAVAQSSRIIQDAFLSIPFGRGTIEVGQQRLPIGLEGSHGSSVLETIERSLMTSDRARGASFGDVRDLGVMAKGRFATLEYRAGVFNGSGEAMNDVDRNSAKAVAAHVVWRPKAVRGFRIGTSGVTSGPATGDKPTRDRAGLDLQFQRGRLLLQAEGMAGRDAAVVRHGMYTLGTWSVAPSLKTTLRFDAWDPNANAESTAADVAERDYTAGITWTLKGTRLRLQSSVVRKTYTRGITPAATLALTQLQATW